MIGKPTRPGFHTVTPYLIVHDVEAYLRFLQQTFGTTEHFRTGGADGGVHVEVRIGDSMVMVGGGEQSPAEPMPAMLFLYLEDVDAVYHAALAAGATSILEPGPNFGEPRGAGIKDPAGNDWYFAVWHDRPDAPPAYEEPHPEPDVTPMLTYEDGVRAMDWLAEAFGFQEVTRWLDEEGKLAHGEMTTGNGRIMLATVPDYENPKRHREQCAPARAWSAQPWVIDGVLVYVDDVDRHCARAQAAGATLLSAPMDDGPGRLYRAEDLEGHRWMFLQRRVSH
jgi:PhnB protein